MTVHDRHRMEDQSQDGELQRLRSIAADLTALVTALLEREQRRIPAGDDGDAAASEAANDLADYTRLSSEDLDQLSEQARMIYRSRRMRPRIFSDDGLFGEPAWDILLDLFIAESGRKPLSVTSACIGAAVPTSTALRWIAILEERGFLSRENDPADARRVFLRLTGQGYAKMVTYFLALQREGAATA